VARAAVEEHLVITGPSLLEERPRGMLSQTSQISTALGTAFVTVTRDPDGQPFEVFLNVGKAGSETFASAEALGRLISLTLRLASPISRSERLRDIAGQLERIGSTANDASLLSIPDALAKVLLEFLSEAAPQEQLEPPPSSVVDFGMSHQENLLAANFMDLQPKRNKHKKSMETNISLSDEILTATEQLAAALLQSDPIAEYQEAKASLDADPVARELLQRFAGAQADLRVRQSQNTVTQADVDQLRALQRQVQSNRRIIDYAETQQIAVAYLPAVNQEISLLLGVDFASLAGPASC
jgi:cell fate (sporulation/competence/biofilm development) regulator YlbF (YheA/YmcA/DUF963 family)